MREKSRGQMLKQFFSELKDLVKGLLGHFMLEECKLYLEEHPTKGNGYHPRDFLTLFGPLEAGHTRCGKVVSIPDLSSTANAFLLSFLR